MKNKNGESHPSDIEKSISLQCFENSLGKGEGKAGKSGEGEVFCKNTWAGKEPLWWRQGQKQIGALWIQGRQKKTWPSIESLGLWCQCQHPQLTALRIFTHTHSHQSPWWLKLLQQKEWDKAEEQEATSLLCRRNNLSWPWGKISTFGSNAAHDEVTLGGHWDRWAAQSSSSSLLCSHQSPSLTWRGWLMPSSSFLYLCSSFLCFPSLHVLACSFQTFRQNTWQ